MTYKVKDFYDAINTLAPFSLALKWDNSGLLLGSGDMPVKRALAALDATRAVIEEAKALGAQLLITHHPVIFEPLRSIVASSPVWEAIRAGLAVISAHTCLDIARGGVNDALAKRLGLNNIEALSLGEADSCPEGMGRIGELPRALSPAELAGHVKESLCAAGLKYVPGAENISRVALCGGAGADYIGEAISAGAKALVTADCRHHQLLEAKGKGFTLIDAGHYATEAVVLPFFAAALRNILPGAEIIQAKSCADPASYL
ncbi:MAG: Nif3-like dinuclear metal center hexameric protein [Oscillospiraceae bacterium]|nr:Nif3-like dinuclear metal center hexameric protein [Oscillospiraceae bacterium]